MFVKRRARRAFISFPGSFYCESFFSCNFLEKKRVNRPQVTPKTAPASTSVGQCTKRKIREKAIRQASTSAGIPRFLEQPHSTVAAAREEQVCPEGKEKPEGGEISRGVKAGKV